jgi:hypothetical protein
MARVRWWAVVVAGSLAVAACSGDDAGDDAGGTTTTIDASTTTTAAGAGLTAAELCADAVLDPDSPPVAEADLTETSGLAASRRNDGVLWMHNDSGGDPEVFAVGLDGAARGRYALEGAEATDWEDMALGPQAPGGDGADRLYLGDIGDNNSQRDDVTVYRVAEPTVAAGDAGDQALGDVQPLTLTYADGARDAETLLADPVTGDLFIVSKQWDGAPAGVYRIPADVPVDPATPTAMERVADAAVPDGELATSGDISADGSLIAIRTYQSVLLWERAPGETVGEALTGDPCKAAATSELQGESLAILPEGDGYVTVSEGRDSPIHRFALP